jgi:hypothetical protein
MPLLPPLVLEVGSGSQVPTFRNSTYLDPQVGLTRNLGVRQSNHMAREQLEVVHQAFLKLSLGSAPRHPVMSCWQSLAGFPYKTFGGNKPCAFSHVSILK